MLMLMLMLMLKIVDALLSFNQRLISQFISMELDSWKSVGNQLESIGIN